MSLESHNWRRMASSPELSGFFPVGGTTNPDRKLDIIFVHGLNGDAEMTWTHDETKKFWPEWLSEDFPDVGVWTIGYNASSSRWHDGAMPLTYQADAVLELLANEATLKGRPLILVGHSMGGLVIKQLVINGRTKGVSRHKSVVDSICGIVFIATPHKGSELATLAKAVSVIYRANPQVGDMRLHDPHLQSLDEQFFAYCTSEKPNVAIRVFSESKGVFKGIRVLGWNMGLFIFVVKPNSASLIVPGEISISLEGDHFGVCKLKDRNQTLYKSTKSLIEDVKTRERNTESFSVEGTEAISERIIFDNLPSVEGEFFGREEELKMLDDALEIDSKTNIIQIVAAGGTGKTKLLRHWLNRVDSKTKIIYSFYAQGSSEDRQVSSTLFFESAFGVLGSQKTVADFGNRPERMGEYLAKLIQERRGLLVLDGLEPMQHAGRGMRGELKDRAIRQLLRSLAMQNDGLCIVTSRIAVHELSDRDFPTVITRDLRNLSIEDGISLLKSLGVHGGKAYQPEYDQLRAAVEEYGCHALALHLLGNGISTFLGGDVLRRDTLGELIDDYDAEGRHAKKVMQAYEEWLTDEEGKPTPELQLLYILGLFEHPIETDVLRVLWQKNIPEITDGVSEKEWQVAIRDLRSRYHILSVHEGVSDLLDCHPLIRDYFGTKFNKKRPEAWKKAHAVLYDYYKSLPEKFLPDTLEEMQPLFSAVKHGCAAGMYQEALDDVYYSRIRRKDNYISTKLGAFGDDLATIANFFSSPWDELPDSLNRDAQIVLLNYAGFRLRAVGRLKEALGPMKRNVEMNIEKNKNLPVEQQNWIETAKSHSNLSELQLTLGNIDDSILAGKHSVLYAEKSPADLFQRITCRTAYADALHQAGKIDSALPIFEEAERIQIEYQPEYPRLYSLRGFRYVELLLSQGRTEDAISRAEYSMKCSMDGQQGFLSAALSSLMLGRSHLQEQTLSSDFPEDKKEMIVIWMNDAVDGLRNSGYQHMLPFGLLSRAAFFRITGKHSDSDNDLKEVLEIVGKTKMLLHLTDYHLEMARLLLAQSETEQCSENSSDVCRQIAKKHVDEASGLIFKTNYHRRDIELKELQESLG